MEDILSSSEKNLLQLVESLGIHEQISFKDLQIHMHVDSKTLRQLIKKANQLFFPIQINRNAENKIFLSIPNNHTIKYCYSVILENSLEFSILESIFFNESYSIFSLSKKLFISESTLRRTIHKINTVLASKGFEIQTPPLKIRGDEKKICNFIVYYLSERYLDYHKFFDDMFHKSKIDFVNHLVKLHFKLSRTKINYPDAEKAKLWMLVTFERMKSRKIKNKKAIYTQQKHKNIFSNFYMELKRNFNIEVIENNSFLFIQKLYKELFLQNRRKRQYSHRKLSLNLIENIKTELAIAEPINKSELLSVLDTVIALQHGPNFILFNQYEFFIKKFSENFPEISKTILDTVKKTFGPILNEQYQIYNIAYVVISHWENLIISIKNKLPIVPAALLFNSDIEHIDFLKTLIEEKFPNRFDLHSLTEFSNLYEVDLSILPYQLFITNIEGLFIKNKDVYCLGLFPSEIDWHFFENYIKNY